MPTQNDYANRAVQQGASLEVPSTTPNDYEDKLIVEFSYGGNDYCMTLKDAQELVRVAHQAMYNLKQKCPTCRCYIYPGSECSCCAQPNIPD